MILTRETKVLGEGGTCPNTTVSTKIPTWTGLLLNLGPLGGNWCLTVGTLMQELS